MWSKKHKFVFVHNKKCAGRSIKKAFKKTFKLNNFDKYRIGGSIHYNLKQFNYYHDEDINNYLKIISVRNPWDRIVSLHHHMVVHDKCNLPFGLFCKEYQRFMKQMQLQNLMDLNGSVNIDMVIKFENLQEDFEKVMLELGVENPPKLTKEDHGNNRKKHYKSCYTDKTRSIIEDIFSWEIEKFNYKF